MNYLRHYNTQQAISSCPLSSMPSHVSCFFVHVNFSIHTFVVIILTCLSFILACHACHHQFIVSMSMSSCLSFSPCTPCTLTLTLPYHHFDLCHQWQLYPTISPYFILSFIVSLSSLYFDLDLAISSLWPLLLMCCHQWQL